MTQIPVTVVTWQEITLPGEYVKDDKRIRIEFDGEYYTLARWSNNANTWQWLSMGSTGSVRMWKTIGGVVRYIDKKLCPPKRDLIGFDPSKVKL